MIFLSFDDYNQFSHYLNPKVPNIILVNTLELEKDDINKLDQIRGANNFIISLVKSKDHLSSENTLHLLNDTLSAPYYRYKINHSLGRFLIKAVTKKPEVIKKVTNVLEENQKNDLSLLIENLETSLMTEWKELCNSMIIDDIEVFKK